MADLSPTFLNPQDPASVSAFASRVIPAGRPAAQAAPKSKPPKPPKQYPTGSASTLPKNHPVRAQIRAKQTAAKQPPPQQQSEPDNEPQFEQYEQLRPAVRLDLQQEQFGNRIANSYTSGGDDATNHIISTYHGKYSQSLPHFPIRLGSVRETRIRPVDGQEGAQEPPAGSPGGSTSPSTPKPAQGPTGPSGPTGPTGPLSPAATAQREGLLPLQPEPQLGRAASLGLGAVEHLAGGGSVGGFVAKTAREAFQRRRG